MISSEFLKNKFKNKTLMMLFKQESKGNNQMIIQSKNQKNIWKKISPNIGRTYLFCTMHFILEKTPQIKILNFTTLLMIKQIKAQKSFVQLQNFDEYAIKQIVTKSIQQYHQLKILSFDEKQKKYKVQRAWFQKLESILYDYVQQGEPQGVTVKKLLFLLNKNEFSIQKAEDFIFGQKGIYLLLKNLEQKNKIYKTPDHRIFILK